MTAFKFAAEDLTSGAKVAVETPEQTLAAILEGPITTILNGMGFSSEAIVEAMEDLVEEQRRIEAMEESRP